VHLQEPKVLIIYTERETMSRILCSAYHALLTIQPEKLLRKSLKPAMYSIGN
jgi:predicted metal-dependent TIM-barrel fold hydrolase